MTAENKPESSRQTAKDNDRVAAALRANLARRKQQQKARIESLKGEDNEKR